MPGKPPVYIVQHNHFDPIWRRCWMRAFDYRGKRYRPYAELEGFFIDTWLDTAADGALFSEGQAVVLRAYAENNDTAIDDLRKMLQDGTLELTAAGEVVPDLNMPSGETLLRNLALGQWWFKKEFGIIPTIGWLEDAFGQSAQVPQIYRSCQCTSLQRLSYKRVPGEYWRGLDGSVIYTGGDPHASYTGGGIKIPPCPECSGTGCEQCSFRGLADESKISDEELRNALMNHEPREPYSMIYVGGEEAVPNPNIAKIVDEVRKARGMDLRWGGFETIARYAADKIARIDDPDLEVSDQLEANPVSTGCYVSRIDIKQTFRLLETVLSSAEVCATLAYLSGADYRAEEFRDCWRVLSFAAFHDAITSTHIDSAYYELIGMMRSALRMSLMMTDESVAALEEGDHDYDDYDDDFEEDDRDWSSQAIKIWNPSSWEREDVVSYDLDDSSGQPLLFAPDGSPIEVLDARQTQRGVCISFQPPPVPPFGFTCILMDSDAKPVDSGEVTLGPGVIENEFYRMEVSDRGITSLVDLETGDDLLGDSGYLLNELVLEEDIGHPWGTMQTPSFSEPLSKYTTSIEIRRGYGVSDLTLTGIYKGTDDGVAALAWRQTARLRRGSRRIDLTTDVDWDTRQRRLRIAFPTAFKTSTATYSIPYGAIERGPYEPDMTGYPSTNGDWPAVYWVDVADPDSYRGIALLNFGTPSHKVQDGVIFLSVLRSPTDSWCLNEPEFYDCPDFDGARDTGPHQFHYSLLPHKGSWREAGVERAARELNHPMIVRITDGCPEDQEQCSGSLVEVEASPNCIVTALKKAENGTEVVARVAETCGQPGYIKLTIAGHEGKPQIVDSLEMNPKPSPQQIELGPFQIKTVLYKK